MCQAPQRQSKSHATDWRPQEEAGEAEAEENSWWMMVAWMGVATVPGPCERGLHLLRAFAVGAES